jgi:hypothetical protein
LELCKFEINHRIWKKNQICQGTHSKKYINLYILQKNKISWSSNFKMFQFERCSDFKTMFIKNQREKMSWNKTENLKKKSKNHKLAGNFEKLSKTTERKGYVERATIARKACGCSIWFSYRRMNRVHRLGRCIPSTEHPS